MRAVITVDDPEKRLQAIEKYCHVVHVSRRAKSVIVEADIEDLKRLEKFEWVKQIAIDREVRLQESFFRSAGEFITNHDASLRMNLTKSEPLPVKVAVIDTGVYDMEGLNVVKHIAVTDDPTENKDHGTWIAHTIAGQPVWCEYGKVSGVIPGTPIIDAQVINKEGYTTLATIIQALDMVADEGAQVINMSLSSPSLCTEAMNNMISSLAGEGILIAVAGGNYGNDSYIGCPANSPDTIAVGSVYTTRTAFKISDFSPVGVDIVAVGGNVNPRQLVVSKVKDRFVGMAGTSMATPFVASALAMLKHMNPAITVAQARYVLAEYSFKPVHVPDPLWGYGVLNYGFNPAELKPLPVSPFYPTSSIQTNPLVAIILTVGLGWAMLKPPGGMPHGSSGKGQQT